MRLLKDLLQIFRADNGLLQLQLGWLFSIYDVLFQLLLVEWLSLPADFLGGEHMLVDNLVALGPLSEVAPMGGLFRVLLKLGVLLASDWYEAFSPSLYDDVC